MTFASGSLRKEDVYECPTCISAQRGGQSAFLRAHGDLVCCSSPVEATACGGTAPAGPAAYVSDSGAGLSVSAGDGRSTPAELCRTCCLWRSPHDWPGPAGRLRATAPARMGAPVCLAVQPSRHH